MPIYEYECNACEHQLEALQKMSDEPLKKCPSCNEDALRKKVSAAAFRLKGGGWYETDFKDKKQNKSSQGQTSSSSDEKDQKPSDSKSKQDSKNNKSSIKNKPKKSQSSVTS